MKEKTLKTVAVLSIAVVTLGLGSNVRAGHATNFLDSIQVEVNAWLEAYADEATPEQRRAVARAAAALNRNSATLQGDLNLLAQASASLEAEFSGDPVIAELIDSVVDRYVDEARAQRDALVEFVHNPAISQSFSNQLFQIDLAIERGSSETNSAPERARAISFALTKARAAGNLARRIIKAPLSLQGQVVTFAGREGDRDRVTISLESNGTFSIPEHGDEPAESGTWFYERTSSHTATLTLVSLNGTGTLDLNFNSSSRGTFRGEATDSEEVAGQFRVSNAE